MRNMCCYITFFSLVFLHAQGTPALIKFETSQLKTEGDRLEADAINKNAVHASAGVGIFFGLVTGYYERIIKKGNKWSAFARVGIGTNKGGFDSIESGTHQVVQAGMLIGGRSSRLELGSGFLLASPNEGAVISLGEPLIHLSGNLNYRYQKPNGLFLFRAGIGWPEIIFIGAGVSF